MKWPITGYQRSQRYVNPYVFPFFSVDLPYDISLFGWESGGGSGSIPEVVFLMGRATSNLLGMFGSELPVVIAEIPILLLVKALLQFVDGTSVAASCCLKAHFAVV